MIHPSTSLRYVSDEVGFGVFATAHIPRGTVVWVRDALDQVLPGDYRDRLEPGLREQLDKYAYVDDDGRWILCWDNTRFVNHSCEATCLGPSFSGFEVAVRDIEPGEQLTDDYRALGLEHHEAFACACGAPSCEGLVTPAETDALQRQWNGKIRAALGSFWTVEQPLAPWIEDWDVLEGFKPASAPTTRARAR